MITVLNTFKGIFLNNFKDFRKALSSKVGTLKCSQLVSSSNKKIMLTTKNVRLDSGHYAKNINNIFILYFSVCGQNEDDRRAVSNFQFSDGNVNTTISKVRLKI